MASSEDDGDESDDEDKPSPFPRELWSTVLGRGGEGSGSSSSSAAGGGDRALGGRHTPYEDLDDKAKKAYYDMVTNPDRFRQYGYGAQPEEEQAVEPEPRTYYPSDGLVENPDEEPFESLLAGEVDYAPDDHITEEELITAASEADDGGSGSEEVDDDNSKGGGGGGGFGFFDLGSRLEAAAHAKEEQDRVARVEAEARKAEEARRLEEVRRQREEEARQRMAETRAREAEIAARKAAEEEERRRVEEARRAEEEEKARKMSEAQDAYWAKKLEEENDRRASLGASEAERRAKERLLEKAREDMERAKAEEEERDRLREEERAREDPHEGEILKEAQMDDLHEREKNWQITEEQSARTTRTDPSRAVPDVSASSFVSVQQRKTDEISRMKQEQAERLRSLNSPLPAPAAPRGASSAPRPAAARGRSSARQVASLASILGGGNTATPSPAPAPPPPPAPRLSLSEMTRLKKDDTGRPAASSAASRGSAGDRAGIPSLAEMTMLKKDNSGVGAAAAAGGPRRPVRQKLPLSGDARSSSTKRGPIRQRLPIGDDDEEADENDDLIRSGRGKTMSIGDYKSKGDGSSGTGAKEDEQKKSKMWGIDIDKIL